MDYERAMLARVIFSGEITRIIDRRVAPEWVSDEKVRNALAFALDHYRKYGAVPSIEIVEDRFTLGLEYAKDPVDAYVDRVVDGYIARQGGAALLKWADKLVESPRDAAEGIQRELSRLVQDTGGKHDVDLISDFEARLEEFRELRKAALGQIPDSRISYPVPWPTLQEVTQGFQPGDFVTISARPKIGKTWVLVYLAVHLSTLGTRCLFVTNEMSPAKIGRRFDAIQFRIPYNRFRSGMISDADMARYEQGLKVFQGRPPVVVVRNPGTVRDVDLKIEEHKPDVVFIDGVYLLSDVEGAKTNWERIVNISRLIKITAETRELPIIVTSQLNRLTDEDPYKVDLTNLSFSDSFGMDSDIVLALFRPKKEKDSGNLIVRMLANREDEAKDFKIKWDLHSMAFHEVENEGGSDGDSGGGSGDVDFEDEPVSF